MDIILQAIFGSYVGWMLSKPREGKLFNISFGILGAMSGSLLLNSFGLPGVTGYNLYSFLVAMTGAVFVIHMARFLQHTRSLQNIGLRQN